MTISQLETAFRHHVPTLQHASTCYSVLVPLVDLPDGPALLYEVRSSRMRRHAGEICFPGGKLEGGESALQCALRETWEELHIPSQEIRIIGPLDFLYLRSDALMYPFLSQISPAGLAALRCCPAEVKDTLLIPLEELISHPPKFYRYRLEPMVGDDFPYEKIGITPPYPWQKGRMEVPVYEDLPYPLWGLTARITYWFLQKAEQFLSSDQT